MTSTSENEVMPSPEITPAPETAEDVNEDLRARVFSKPSPKSASAEVPVATIDKAAINGDSDSVISSTTISGDLEKATESSKETSATAATEQVLAADSEKAANKPAEKPAEKEQPTVSDTIVVNLPKDKSTGPTDDSAAKTSGLPQNNFNPINGSAAKITTPAKEPAKKAPQVVITPPKKPVVKPAPITTATATAQKKPPAAKTPITPTKRTAEPTTVTSSEIKRAKIVPSPIAPTTPTIMSRIPPGSPSPRPMSVERKLAEQRKKLEALRQKRLETAKKQEELDKQMEPYKKRMAEELERLNKEMMEEEAAAAEDEAHLNASVEMLAEFEKESGGV